MFDISLLLCQVLHAVIQLKMCNAAEKDENFDFEFVF